MPMPHTILAESNMNWRRAAPLFGVFSVIAFVTGSVQPVRMGPAPIRPALPDCSFGQSLKP